MGCIFLVSWVYWCSVVYYVPSTIGDDVSDERWKHRRRMAYSATAGGLLVPVLAIIFSAEISGWAIPFYGFCGVVVGAYIGGSVVDDRWQK